MDKHEPARQMAPPHGGVGGWGPPRTKRDSELENMKGQKLPGGGGAPARPRAPGPGRPAPSEEHSTFDCSQGCEFEPHVGSRDDEK